MPQWFEVTLNVPHSLEEHATALLFELGTTGVECVESGDSVSLIAYCLDVLPTDGLTHLLSILWRTDRHGTPASVRWREIRTDDWAENWKLHFLPVSAGRQLWIAPPWDTSDHGERIRVVIEPGMAFGTGQHATTRSCVELIEEAQQRMTVGRALDIGTGSGILAIALAKLGAPSVWAVDNDPCACAIASDNLHRNQVEKVVTVVDTLPSAIGFFDLIVANLSANTVRDLAPQVALLRGPRGAFICSGFLASDESGVRAAYPSLSVVDRREEDGWVTLWLAKGQ
jgi:ribosomal protein L11 methyltransferase